MSKKNGGLNDREDDSGEQSHIDGNSGIDNRGDDDDWQDPPETMSREQFDEQQRVAKTPTLRKASII